MTKYLRVHNNGADVTGGKRYEIVEESAELYTICDDAGDEHAWTKADAGITFTLETDEITVLPDESLGAVLREYREVKRKAAVGERIKLIGERQGCEIGSVYTVEDADFAWGGNGDLRDGTGIAFDGGRALFHEKYVVLEPTEILVIGSERFRMVDRKAAVGERVIVTKSRTFNMKPGDIGVCTLTDEFTDASIDANLDGYGPVFIDCAGEGYAILEPVVSADAAPEPALLSDQPAESQAAASIASLALRLTQAEAKIAALESVISERKVASGPVDNALPSFSKSPSTADEYADIAARMFASPPVKSAQQIRDEIVERAKADVLDMRKFSGTKIPNDRIAFWPETKLPHTYIPMHTVWFEVNRAKRTVVAIIRCDDDGLITRGIAKCAPGETFNSHIGRAIALRRALGLEVPAEYLDAPQPESVRVGDVITSGYNGDTGIVKSLVDGAFGTPGLTYDRPNPRRPDGYTWTFLDSVVIIDDSREGLALSQRKEAA